MNLHHIGPSEAHECVNEAYRTYFVEDLYSLDLWVLKGSHVQQIHNLEHASDQHCLNLHEKVLRSHHCDRSEDKATCDEKERLDKAR